MAALAAAAVLAACAGLPPRVGMLGDPVALAATPDGRLWGIDAASASVVVLQDGRMVDRLGGVGTGDEALLDPVDLDPTNGQTVFVADRAAGAIVQFTAEGRVSARTVVPDVDPAAPLRQTGRAEGRRGQPIAVAAAPDGSLYVLDAGRRHVLRLDPEGTVERILGAGGLAEPVDLAVADDGGVWVADAGAGVVRHFDVYGAAQRDIRSDAAAGRIVGLSVLGSVVAVAQTRRLTVSDGDDVVVAPRDDAAGDLRAVAFVSRAHLALLTGAGIETWGDAVRD